MTEPHLTPMSLHPWPRSDAEAEAAPVSAEPAEHTAFARSDAEAEAAPVSAEPVEHDPIGHALAGPDTSEWLLTEMSAESLLTEASVPLSLRSGRSVFVTLVVSPIPGSNLAWYLDLGVASVCADRSEWPSRRIRQRLRWILPDNVDVSVGEPIPQEMAYQDAEEF